MLNVLPLFLLVVSGVNAVLSPFDTDALLTGTIEVPSEARVTQPVLPVSDNSQPIPPLLARGLPNIAKTVSVRNKPPSISVIHSSVNEALSKISTAKQSEAKLGAFDTLDSATSGFGPHLSTNPQATALADFADLMLETAKDTTSRLRVQARPQIQKALSKVGTDFLVPAKRRCPFTTPVCDPSHEYRSPDGSCNNVKEPLWGKAFTAFERFLPPAYGDGVNSPRTRGLFGALPSARNISLEVHTNLNVKARKLSHFAMEFGQLVSHDIQMNALAKGYGGRNLDCCRFKKRRNCFPIPVADNDEFFETNCLNFVRALPAPPLDCRLGVRQQLNQVSHFLDGSVIYGSDIATQDLLRDGAFLKSQGNNDLLPLNPNAICAQTSRDKCFRAGDVRVNQQPALISLQTVWMRHHNNVARQLKNTYPDLNDENVFQKTKKIVSAQLQHITYKEWLQEILGNDNMIRFDLKPRPNGEYYTGYNEAVKPMIRNVFSAAAFRFGHSLIGNDLKEKKSSGSTIHHRLHTTFLKPDLVYNGGVNSFIAGLYTSPAHKTDNHLTHEVTRHLFETAPKNGIDLAATNIQRGRDHGIFDYNTWRLACKLGMASDFDALDLHATETRNLLKKVYDNVFDIDLFTGGVSEEVVPGGNIGATFACLVGLQFQALKKGDRFFYESDTNVKFPIKLLDEIKKTTMAKILCDTTGVTSIPRNVFRKQSSSNPAIPCGDLPNPDLAICTPVDGEWGTWSSWSVSNGCIPVRTRKRQCDNPAPNSCGLQCKGSQREVKIGRTGGGVGGGIFDLTGNNCGVKLPGPPTLPRLPRLPNFPIRTFPNIPLVPNLRNKVFPL